MRRFLDARGLEPDPSGSCIAALNKATEVARGAGLDGMAVDYPLQDWARIYRHRASDPVAWKGLEVFTVTDATAANMAASGELVSWAAGLLASKADDVGPKPRILDARWWTEEVVAATTLKRLTDLAKISKCTALWIPADKYAEAEPFIAGANSRGYPQVGIAYRGVVLISEERSVHEYELVTIPDDVPDWGEPADWLITKALNTGTGLEPGDAVTLSAPEEPREEIYRRLRLANDKAEAALNALESAVGVIRMLRGGDDV